MSVFCFVAFFASLLCLQVNGYNHNSYDGQDGTTTKIHDSSDPSAVKDEWFVDEKIYYPYESGLSVFIDSSTELLYLDNPAYGMTWDEARKSCQARSRDLMTNADNVALTSSSPYWIGLYKDMSSQWRWTDGTRYTSYMYGDRESRGCGYLYGSQWQAAQCSDNSILSAVCGKKKDIPPNIIVLLADDLGYADVFEHAPGVPTPNLDRMSGEGLRLTHMLTPAPVCTPSRAGLITGRYPVRMGMAETNRRAMFPNRDGGLPASELTMAEGLRAAGYNTAYFGKWHLGMNKDNGFDGTHLPTRHGFDEYYGYPLSLNPQCMDIVPDQYKALFCYVYDGEEVVEQPMRLQNMTQRLTDRVLDYLSEQRVGNPFFVFFSFLKVHTPLFAREEFQGASDHGAYGDNVVEMDYEIGRIMDYVRENLPNTLVLFTSDNGPYREEGMNAGDPGVFRGGKTNNFEGGIRVPAVVWWPDHIPAWSTSAELVSFLDMVPTFFSLANYTVPDGLLLDGKNVTDIFLNPGEAQTPHDHIFHYCGTEITAMRYGDLKAHFITPNFVEGYEACSIPSNAEGAQVVGCACTGPNTVEHNPPLLYNIARDPGELYPLDASNYEEEIKIMHDLIKAHENTLDSEIPNQLLTKFEVDAGGLPIYGNPQLSPCCNPPYCRCEEGYLGVPAHQLPSDCDSGALATYKDDVSACVATVSAQQTCTEDCANVYFNLQECMANPPKDEAGQNVYDMNNVEKEWEKLHQQLMNSGVSCDGHDCDLELLINGPMWFPESTSLCDDLPLAIYYNLQICLDEAHRPTHAISETMMSEYQNFYSSLQSQYQQVYCDYGGHSSGGPGYPDSRRHLLADLKHAVATGSLEEFLGQQGDETEGEGVEEGKRRAEADGRLPSGYTLSKMVSPVSAHACSLEEFETAMSRAEEVCLWADVPQRTCSSACVSLLDEATLCVNGWRSRFVNPAPPLSPESTSAKAPSLLSTEEFGAASKRLSRVRGAMAGLRCSGDSEPALVDCPDKEQPRSPSKNHVRATIPERM